MSTNFTHSSSTRENMKETIGIAKDNEFLFIFLPVEKQNSCEKCSKMDHKYLSKLYTFFQLICLDLKDCQGLKKKF